MTLARKMTDTMIAFWHGGPISAPTPVPTPEPGHALVAASNVICLPMPSSASEQIPEPTPSFVFLEPLAPREIAKRHARALVQHLITELNSTQAENRTLPYPEMKKAYDALCEGKTDDRPWNMVAKYVNRLIREGGKPLKPYKDVIDPGDRTPRKARAYKIPKEMPHDWENRLRD